MTVSSIRSITKTVLAEGKGFSNIAEEYRRRTPKSAETFSQAEKSQPCGVSRQVGRWGPYPLTMTRGDGPYLWDVDGNRYIDLLGNFTSLIHGNNYGPIREAVLRALPDGTAWAANNLYQTSLAEQIVDRMPGVDQVRFTNSGTEAGNLALLIARAITGRHGLLMARFGYHGGLHEFEVGSFNIGGPHTYLAEYGNVASFAAVLEQHGNDIAAIFVEGVLGAGGMRPAPAAFFTELKALAQRHGALLVIDEVISLRLGLGGQQGNLGVSADLTMLGKLIGGGFPVGAVGGTAEVMRVFDPDDLQVWHSGTFNANPITMAAGDVSVRELTTERITTMNELSAIIRQQLEFSAARYGLPFVVNHCGSLLNLFFMEQAPDDITARDDHQVMTQFHLACLNRGLMIAGRGMLVLSTVMTRELIDEVVDRLDLAMKDLAEELN